MLKGLYKVDMSTADGTRRGVVYCYDDKILGGNSVYGFIGTQRQAEDGEIVATETGRDNSNECRRHDSQQQYHSNQEKAVFDGRCDRACHRPHDRKHPLRCAQDSRRTDDHSAPTARSTRQQLDDVDDRTADRRGLT